MSHPFDYAALPADLLRSLLLGFTGRAHLHSIAGVALEHSGKQGDMFSCISGDALLAAWAENPFDAQCASLLASHGQRLPFLDSHFLPVIKSVMVNWQSDVTPEAERAMAGDKGGQLTFIKERLQHSPRNIFWWHHFYEYSRIHGDWDDLLKALVTATPPEGLGPLFHWALANALFASGDHLAACGMYRECVKSFPVPLVEARLATSLQHAGKVDDSYGLLRDCVGKRPWNVGRWLRLYALAAGGVTEVEPLPGKVMILGYSYNKAADLAETLTSLLKSDLGDAHVRILDNGSTDTTADVIRTFVDSFGSDRASMVSIPVNIGAPAARNWLMALPEVQASDFVAYIDDDISLPKDWLHRLGAAVKRYPTASVWGCKVVDHSGPTRVQCGEQNLNPSPKSRQQTLLSLLALQESDFGQADYIRPCASVTGCVHLFRSESFREFGGFDLRFSPTQYDDLERDLRMVKAGGYAVYQGFLSIAHKRNTGNLSDAGKPESANAMANMSKLMAKYTPQEFETMAAIMDVVLLADLKKKMKALSVPLD